MLGFNNKKQRRNHTLHTPPTTPSQPLRNPFATPSQPLRNPPQPPTTPHNPAQPRTTPHNPPPPHPPATNKRTPVPPSQRVLVDLLGVPLIQQPLQARHPAGGQMAVLQQHPAAVLRKKNKKQKKTNPPRPKGDEKWPGNPPKGSRGINMGVFPVAQLNKHGLRNPTGD